MTDQSTTVSLMRMALALLERNGMTAAACQLEQALQVVLAQESMRVEMRQPPA